MNGQVKDVAKYQLQVAERQCAIIEAVNYNCSKRYSVNPVIPALTNVRILIRKVLVMQWITDIL